MEIETLAGIELADADGSRHRLGDLWADTPVILVFARHFGWLHCRAHAAQLRRRYDEIRRHGAELVIVGTGDARYAREFVKEESIPCPVLVDESGEAARAATVRRAGLFDLFHPASYPATAKAWRDGYRVYWPGKRVNQLGATFVLGPGPAIRYSHYDAHPADHAPMDDVLATLGT